MLLGESKSWIELNYINDIQREKIINHYTKSDNVKISHILFAILGALFIGTGIISLIAHNWTELPKVARFFVGILPLIIAQILGIYAFKNKSNSKAWMEGVGVFWFLSFGAALAIIGQTYHLGSSVKDFFLTWIIVSFPLIYLLKSDTIAFMVLGLLNGWFYETYRSGFESKLIFISLLCIWFIYYLYKAKFYKNTKSFMLLTWGFIFTLLICLQFFLRFDDFLNLYAYVLMLSGFYYINHLFFQDFSHQPFAIASKLGIAFIVLISLGLDVIQPKSQLYIFLALFSLLGFIYLNSKKRVNDILYPLMPLLVWFLTLDSGIYALRGIVLAFILAYMIYNSSLDGDTLEANFSMSILVIGLFIEFSVNDFGFITQGVAFILLGFGFLYMNKFIQKRKSE